MKQFIGAVISILAPVVDVNNISIFDNSIFTLEKKCICLEIGNIGHVRKYIVSQTCTVLRKENMRKKEGQNCS